MKNIKLEICVGNINDIIKTKDLNIDRYELNSALELGGLTPTLNTLIKAKEVTDIPIMCMTRVRGGGFIYSQDEIDVMLKDAETMIKYGADGIVFGFLNDELEIDIPNTKKMREITKGKTLVFHKAFDYVLDQEKAIKELIEIGIDRILLMGSGDILDCAKNISKLNQKYGDKIELLPGGGINKDNIIDVLNITNVSQIHGTFKDFSKDISTNEKIIINSYEKIQEIIKLIK